MPISGRSAEGGLGMLSDFMRGSKRHCTVLKCASTSDGVSNRNLWSGPTTPTCTFSSLWPPRRTAAVDGVRRLMHSMPSDSQCHSVVMTKHKPFHSHCKCIPVMESSMGSCSEPGLRSMHCWKGKRSVNSTLCPKAELI